MNEFADTMKRLFDILVKSGAIKEFRALMMVYAEMTAREMMTANEENLLHALRGQMRFCFELADRASQALNAKEAEAKASDAEGTPDEL